MEDGNYINVSMLNNASACTFRLSPLHNISITTRNYAPYSLLSKIQRYDSLNNARGVFSLTPPKRSPMQQLT